MFVCETDLVCVSVCRGVSPVEVGVCVKRNIEVCVCCISMLHGNLVLYFLSPWLYLCQSLDSLSMRLLALDVFVCGGQQRQTLLGL